MNHIKVTKLSDIKREWYLYDMTDKILGRTVTLIAQRLIGKDKPYFVRNLDCGDYVVVINAVKVKVTGKKADQKMYSSYSGYPGGLKQISFNQTMKRNPAYIIKEAVSGMLPQNKLRASMLKRLFVFSGEDHPYKAKFRV